MLGLTRQLALELAPAISVNAIAPGPVLAPPYYDEKKLADTAEKTLFNRWGTSQDVVEAVLFFVRLILIRCLWLHYWSLSGSHRLREFIKKNR